LQEALTGTNAVKPGLNAFYQFGFSERLQLKMHPLKVNPYKKL
jgi:hypothetical protein